MTRKLPEDSFGPEKFRQFKGNSDNFLDQVEDKPVIQRLNDILDEKWSFKILEIGGLAASAISKSNSGLGCSLG